MKNLVLSLLILGVAGCATAPVNNAVPEGAERTDKGCNTPLGFIADGRTATGYLHQIEQSGLSCQQGTISCENGTWTGAYIYPSCTRLP